MGIIFDQFLSFDDYISSVCRSTHFHLRNIGRIRHLLSQNATAQLIHALISICLDYRLSPCIIRIPLLQLKSVEKMGIYVSVYNPPPDFMHGQTQMLLHTN